MLKMLATRRLLKGSCQLMLRMLARPSAVRKTDVSKFSRWLMMLSIYEQQAGCQLCIQLLAASNLSFQSSNPSF